MKKHLIILGSLIVGTCALWAENPEWNVVGQTVSISHTLAGNTAGSWAYEEEKDSETGAYPATFVVLTEATARDLALIPEREKSYEPQSFANSGLEDIDRLILEPLSDDNELLGTVAFKHASLNTTMVEYACLRYSIPYQIAKMHTTYDSEGNVVKREIFYYKVTEIVDENISGSNYVNALVIPHTIEYVPQNAHLKFVNTDTVWMLNAHCRYENGAGNLLPKNKLSTIVFADGFDTIPDGICGFAKELDSVCIPNSVISIGGGAFTSCSGLTGELVIPNSVTNIGDYTFAGCTGLTSVTIPNSVTSIGDDAFGECTGLTSINVASDNSNYCSVDGVLFNKDKTTLIQYPGGKQGAYTILNSVTSIGSYTFAGCTGLTSVTIPNSVTSIGNYAFYHCTSLTSVTIPNSVTNIRNYAFFGCTGLTSVTIPNSVTNIGYHAFDGCSSLTSMTIPNSVTSIRQGAFIYCIGLTSIEIPNSVTSIEYIAFFKCSSLTSVTIPNSVTSIGDYAFYYCSGLTSIICMAIVPPTMDDSVFSGVDKSIPLFVPAGSVEAYRNTGGWNEFTNILPIQVAEVTEETVADITAINHTSVIVKWPKVENAETYKVVITSEGDTACVLTFDADGSLISHRFYAIARRANRQNAQAASLTTNGWQYVITGLDENKQYTYSLTVKGADDALLFSQSVAFTTSAPQGIEDVLTNPSAPKDGKILHNGQIYILRDGKVYDLTGQRK